MLTVAAVVTATFAISACDSDSPTSSRDGTVRADTSYVRIAHLGYTACTADGAIETGIELQWQIAFESTTNRRLRIFRHSLEHDSNVILDHRTLFPPVHKSGELVSGKEVWIPINAPTPEGVYRFRIYYEIGRQSVNAVGDTLWHRIVSGLVDTAFSVSL